MPVNAVVIATTTFSKTYDMRAKLAVKLVKACAERGYPVVVVDGGSDAGFRGDLMAAGAEVCDEAGKGMGAARRQAMTVAGEGAGPDGLVLWCEPEKYTIVPEIAKMEKVYGDTHADLVVPDRGPLDSYPIEQQLAEPLGNLAFERITGLKLDMWSGPRLMNQAALRHFLDYQGEYGDLWDCIFIPVLRAMKAGLKVVSAPINYVHPPEQTSAEETPEMLKKRVIQLNNLVPAMVDEAKKIGLIPLPQPATQTAP